MKKLVIGAALAALAVAGCGGGKEARTVTQARTVTVATGPPQDMGERVAEFTTAGNGNRTEMQAWFDAEMCDGLSSFACRCVSDRLSWQHESADDYAAFVIDLIGARPSAMRARNAAERRCDALTADAVVDALAPEHFDAVRTTVSDMKRTTAQILGERVEGAADSITCDEWEKTPRSVKRVLARSIIENQPLGALFGQATNRELLGRIDLGCDEYPEDSATGWIAAEMVLAGGGESTLP